MQSPSQDKEEQRRYAQISYAGMVLVRRAMEAGLIKERDLFTLFALVNNAHPWTGHVWPTAQACFEEMGSSMARTNIATSLKRLKEADLVKRFKDKRTASTSYAINPRVIGVGPNDAQRKLWEKWQADKI